MEDNSPELEPWVGSPVAVEDIMLCYDEKGFIEPVTAAIKDLICNYNFFASSQVA